jgi:hypothetical protein
VGKLFDVGQEATGFIAIGQIATGFFAFGQVATGVIAIGQVARGFVVVGQAGFGLISAGMASGGLIFSVGMLGAGGRGLGGILPLVPRLTDPRDVPDDVSFDSIARGGIGEGWVRVKLVVMSDATVRLELDGAPLPVRLDARLRRAAPTHSGRLMLAFLRQAQGGIVCERLMEVPPVRVTQPRWWAIWAAQVALLLCGTVAFWFLVARPILETLEKILS